MEKNVKTIKRSSRTGLWVTVGAVILTAAFLLTPFVFRLSEYHARWMLVSGVVLAVLAVSMTLLTVRRRVPQMRQLDTLEEKLDAYAQYVRSVFYTMAAVVVILCVFVILSGNSVLLMLAMVSTLVLFLNFPNIYRIKVDLGLSDDEMRSLFGEKYISGNDQE